MASLNQLNEKYLKIFPLPTITALEKLSEMSWLADSSWYLAGGTGLALQAGHRVSVDLDFFLPEDDFNQQQVLTYLTCPQWQTDIVEKGTVYGTLVGARVSFLAYPLFVPVKNFVLYKNIKILHEADIAVMKLVALSQRGRRRDFYDLYWYALNREPLLEVIKRLPKQYPKVAHDYHHIVKSLVYFADAEEDPEPELMFKADWGDVKSYFQKEAKEIARTLLKLS